MGPTRDSQDKLDFRALFEGAPIAIWDEDFSAVKQYLDELTASGVVSLRSYLVENRQVVLECLRRVRVRRVNRMAREFYGAEDEAMLRDSLPRLFDEPSLSIFRDEIIAFAEGARSFTSEVVAQTLKGEAKPVQMNISILPGPSNDWSQVIVAFTDLTERRNLEQSLRHANEDLKRINTDLDRFAYAAAHDLREPLRTVALYTQMLQRIITQEAGEQAHIALKYVLDGARRMETIVHDLLVFAQATDSPTGTTWSNANEVVADVIAGMQAVIQSAGAHVELRQLPDAAIDYGHLRQVLQNLLVNAIKYRHPDRAPHVVVSGWRSADETTFCVSDNGIGIAPEYLDKIFGVFQRLHGKEVSGSGIGLALCKRLIQHCGGRIWATSVVGSGSRFFFTVPV